MLFKNHVTNTVTGVRWASLGIQYEQLKISATIFAPFLCHNQNEIHQRGIKRQESDVIANRVSPIFTKKALPLTFVYCSKVSSRKAALRLYNPLKLVIFELHLATNGIMRSMDHGSIRCCFKHCRIWCASWHNAWTFMHASGYYDISRDSV